MYPTRARPYFGVFVERQVEAVRRLGVDARVEVVAGERGQTDYLLARRRVTAAVRAHRPDLVHCHYGYTPLAAAHAGVPYLVSLCGDDINGQSDGKGGISLKSRVGIVVSQRLAARARGVIVKSRQMLSHLDPSTRARAHVLPNGVDTALFTPGSMAEARRRLGLSDGPLVLGFVNSVGQRGKRIDLARAVRDAIARRGTDVHLLVAETVPSQEMPWVYRAADCLLVTSDSEGAPNAVKEALACGTPVVSVPVGDIPDLIVRPETGRVVSRDVGALADAVVDVGRATQPRRSLLPAELEDAAVAARLIALYRSMLA